MNEQQSKELAAFESFKFNVGEIVTHVTSSYGTEKGIVLERALVQSEYGFFRWYSVAFSTQPNVIVTEAELRPYQSTRM